MLGPSMCTFDVRPVHVCVICLVRVCVRDMPGLCMCAFDVKSEYVCV